jgi:hypothetical protein
MDDSRAPSAPTRPLVRAVARWREIALALGLALLPVAVEAATPWDRPVSEAQAVLAPLLGCRDLDGNLAFGCSMAPTGGFLWLFRGPNDETLESVELRALIAGRPPSSEVRSRQSVIAAARYLLPGWRDGPAWLTKALADAVHPHAKRAIQIDGVTVLVQWLEPEDREDGYAEIVFEKSLALDDPRMRGLTPDWRPVASLASAAGRRMLREEMIDSNSCGGRAGWEFHCSRVRIALVPVAGGSSLLLLRYSSYANCGTNFVVYGPADRRGGRALITRFCGERLELVKRQDARAWPDVRLTNYLCDASTDPKTFCRDSVFRWDGADWQTERQMIVY